jgi:hypothetical protein
VTKAKNDKLSDLTQARALVRDLAKVEPKNAGDQRFIQTWRSYLDHAGDQAVIGRFRLHNLRVVSSSYGLCPQSDPTDLRSPGLARITATNHWGATSLPSGLRPMAWRASIRSSLCF